MVCFFFSYLSHFEWDTHPAGCQRCERGRRYFSHEVDIERVVWFVPTTVCISEQRNTGRNIGGTDCEGILQSVLDTFGEVLHLQCFSQENSVLIHVFWGFVLLQH